MKRLSARLLLVATLFCTPAAMAQDRDGDGIPDGADNCPALHNTNQSDPDGDGFGNLCDCEDPAYTIQIQRGQRRLEGSVSVSNAGDVDGDGVGDIVLGEQRPLEGCEDTRTYARVVSGRTREVLWELSSGEPCDGFGFAVAGAGDVDGDGRDDVIAGAPQGGDGGRAYVFSGATGELLSRGGAPFTFAGQRPGDRFGTSVVGVGDVDRDGVDDVAVGAPFHDSNGPGRGRPGRVYVFRGGAARNDGAGELLFTIDGNAEGEVFSSALAAGGDFNGDGLRDIVIGAQPAMRSAPGRARICSGVDGATLLELKGVSPDEVFAAAIAFAGDVDGDGLDDVAVGAPSRDDPAGGNPGRVYVIRGGAPRSPAGAPELPLVIEGFAGAGLFGMSVAGIGDQNGDGLGDIAIGTPVAGSGEARGAGRVQVYSVRDRSVLVDIGGRGPREGFGRVVAALGDLDRSGHRDLAVSDVSQGGTVSVYLLGDADGNGRRDTCEPCREPDAIQPGESLDFALCPLVPRRCFRIDPAPGQVLRIALESTVDDETVMALGWGTPPSERQFDALATRTSGSLQQIVISRARKQTAYVVVESLKADACAGKLRIRLESGDAPIVDEMLPRAAGGDRVLDVVVRGAGFATGLEFALLSRAPEDPPAQPFTGVTTIVDGETAEVTFDLRGAPVGLYDLIGRAGDEPVVRLEKAFAVAPTRGSALQVSLDGPAFYRVGDRRTLTLRYANKGDEEIPAPLFLVTTEGADIEAEMRLAGDTTLDWSTVVQVLGVNRDGPGHTLPPGTAGSARIHFRTSLRCDLCRLRFRVLVFTPDPRDFIDWQRLPNPDPINLEEKDWRRALSPLSVNLGLTWRDYHASLLDRSRRLARRGRNPASVQEIFRFSVAEALGHGVAAIVGNVLLSSDLAPIAKAFVIARSGGAVRSMAVTDALGRFALEGLLAGTTYDVSVAGHAPAKETPTRISVPEERYSAAGEGDVLNVVLAVEPDDSGNDRAPLPDVERPLPESALIPSADLFTPVAGAQVGIVLSQDPNKKTFNVTPGDVLFFDDEEDEPEEPEPEEERTVPPPVIEYTIFFENSRCASVAARTVTVIDTLNTEMFDLSTLRLEAMSIGEDLEENLVFFDEEDADIFTRRLVTRTLHDVPVARVPPVRELPPECDGGELPDCEGGEEMDPEAEPPDYAMLEEVMIKVGLRDLAEENKTELVWDIDGCPSGCASVVGFLPPNDCGTHQGEGFVCFTISPVEGLEDGVVENDVDVVFDDDYTAALSHHVTTDLGPAEPPAPPTDPVPRDNPAQDDDFLVPVDQALSWAPALETDSYNLSVWKLDGGGSRVAEVVAAELAETFYLPEQPWELSTTYEWELVASSDLGDSPASLWVFRTEGTAPPPPDLDLVPVYPPVGSEAIATDLELAWDVEGSGEPSSFTVYVWDASEERDRPNAHVGDVKTYRPNDLESGVAYNWQVVGVTSGGSSESQVWSFSIGDGAGEPVFLRGDANADGETNIADAILTLNFLFLGDVVIPCLEAADFDDDGALLITDPIAQVGFLFLGGPGAPPPTGTCGPDGTPDGLGCESFPACR